MNEFNTIGSVSIDRQLQKIEQSLRQVELFLIGKPIGSIRIGTATITSAHIANLSVTNAKFIDAAITNAKITTVDAGKFTTGSLSADRIAANSITAEKLDVDELSAISTNVGTITSGAITGNTITGGVVQTGTSGDRVEMSASPNAMRLYDSGGVEKYRFDPDGLKMYDTGTHWYRFSDGTFWGSFFMASSTETVLQAGGSIDLDFISGQSGGDIQLVSANDEINVFPGGSGQVFVNGSAKAAILNTSGGYKALYCLESPEVWFFDIAKDERSIDPVFLEATEGDMNMLNTDQGELLVFRRRRGFGVTRFEAKTVEQFDRNNQFWGNHGFK